MNEALFGAYDPKSGANDVKKYVVDDYGVRL